MSIHRKPFLILGPVALTASTLLVLSCNLTSALSAAGSSPSPMPQMAVTDTAPPAATTPALSPAPTQETSGAQAAGNSPAGGLPSDVPVYPGATPAAFQVQGIVAYDSNDSQAKVSSFFKAQLPGRGWSSVPLDQNAAAIATLKGWPVSKWTKGTRTMLIVIEPNGNGSAILYYLNWQQ